MEQIEPGIQKNSNSKGNLITPIGSWHDLGKRYMSLSTAKPERVMSSKRVNSSLDYTSERKSKNSIEPKSAILDNIQLLNSV